ncbi:cytochrome c oxidase assembly protein [Methylophilus sp.]|uniref:cytochrome c oxidase assembly protein n=1 Tax=Methylophilus sp. TaxID=29541 RepID=UPI0040375CCA
MNEQQAQANKKLALKLVWIIVGALLFAFALVPLYDVFCSVTGLNGKTSNIAQTATSQKVDTSREVTVQFVSAVMPGLGWNFYPKQASVKVHPGQVTVVMFEAKNITSEVVAGQAIPSVTPGKASAHLKKIECFCFVRQSLDPGQVKLLPLRFFISADLPPDVNELTLSYSFFPATNDAN